MSNERVTDSDVRSCTGVASEGSTEQAINIAEVLVTDYIVAADSTLSTDMLYNIEVFLASHFFWMSIRSGPLAAEDIGTAAERYHNIYGPGLKATWFGQQAIALDPTGELAKMADRAENPQRKSALFRVVGSPPA